MSRLETMSAAVIEIIDSYSVGHQFYGNQLKDDVVRLYPDAKYMYPDTLLRMARRHRRGAFRVVNRNRSLYEKVSAKSIIEQIGEVAPKEETPVKQTGQAKQGELPFFSHGFLGVFLVAFFGFCFALDSGYGRPLFPPSLMASKSASFHIPVAPIYIYGFLPARWSRLLTASEEIPNRCENSNVVSGKSIYIVYSHFPPTNQVVNAEMSIYLDILLYRRIVDQWNFSQNSLQKLDNSNYREYILNRLYVQI